MTQQQEGTMGQPLTVDMLTYAWERYTGWGHPSVEDPV